MDKFSAMQVFRRVVEAGSFSAVARESGLSQPTISKQIANLEAVLETKLLQRSTRQLQLTAAGQTYYERCCQLLDELDDTETSLRELQSIPTGLLRLNAPITFGRLEIVPRLWKFMAQYPDLKIDMQMDDHYIDLVKEGIDVAIRIGPLTDSSLIARKIGEVTRHLVASPDYLARKGSPRKLHDLKQHDCIIYTLLTTFNEWHFEGPHGKEKINVTGKFSTNNPDVIREALLAGMGIAAAPLWLVREDIKAGRLKVIMQDYKPTPLALNALYPERRFLPVKVSLFINYLEHELQKESA